MKRRRFLRTAGGLLVAGAGALTGRFFFPPPTHGTFVRPPGALRNDQFLAACIRCGNCAAVCERGCVVTHPLSVGATLAGAPYIDPRVRACNLCMRCTEVCPTGALRSIPKEKSAIMRFVSMGLAVVDEALCISFLGRMCGLCRDACPYPGDAIKLTSWARPIIVEQRCVGCGLCVEICPQQPTAIRIDTTERRVV